MKSKYPRSLNFLYCLLELIKGVSVDGKLLVRHELFRHSFCIHISQSHTPSWASISVHCQTHCFLHEFFALSSWHSRSIIRIDEAMNKSGAWASYCTIQLQKSSSQRNLIDLSSILLIPSSNYYCSIQLILVVVTETAEQVSSCVHLWKLS